MCTKRNGLRKKRKGNWRRHRRGNVHTMVRFKILSAHLLSVVFSETQNTTLIQVVQVEFRNHPQVSSGRAPVPSQGGIPATLRNAVLSSFHLIYRVEAEAARR